MNQARQYLLYIVGNRIDGYVDEGGKFEKTSVFEDFQVDAMSAMWEWFVGAMSYKQGKETVDLCVIGDCDRFEFDSDRVVFERECTIWSKTEIERCLTQIEPTRKYELSVKSRQADNRQFTVNNAQQGFAFAEAITMNVFISGNVEAEAAAVVGGNDDGAEAGVLYRYFNELSRQYEEK